ncbi:MAG TPA: hypothetical protein P5556_07160 [Candidatus Gastranaerophilales bacterium]|nr:hypothetical protein [Candidatus Gastranaerophilales bacterium]
MKNNQENKKLIETIIRQSPGFRANKDLFDEIMEESVKKVDSFLEKSSSESVSEIYLKKIISSVIIDIIKKAEKIREEKNKQPQKEPVVENQEVPIKYLTDEQGKIIYDVEIKQTVKTNEINISEEKINVLKAKIKKLDKEAPSKEYKRIFELRFLRQMNYKEISKKLELPENEILITLQELFKELNLILS